jgi:hypothetical protein
MSVKQQGSMEIRKECKEVRKNSRKKDGSIGNKKAKRHASPFYVGYGGEFYRRLL